MMASLMVAAPVSAQDGSGFAALMDLLMSKVPPLSWAGLNAYKAPPPVAVTRAQCGPGSRPETGLQGQVSLADRQSGRSAQGYQCNMALVGQYQGVGSDWVSASNGRCAYMPTSWHGTTGGTHAQSGIQVIDFSDPAKPRYVRTLATRAARSGTWESLRISPDGAMLAAVSGGATIDFNKFDLYDIRDCTNPKLLNKQLLNPNESSLVLNIGHEGEWSPDSKTYWTTGFISGTVSAIDVSNPARPVTIYHGWAGAPVVHGMSFSPDGRRLYMTTDGIAGLLVLDVSAIQDRKLNKQITPVSSLFWKDGFIGQRPHPVMYGTRPYLIYTDESRSGGVRLIDIADDRNPKVVTHIRLSIQLPEHKVTRTKELAKTGGFGYESHYCTPDKDKDPSLLACTFFQSGVRVFDIADPQKPREVAYFNPPAQTGKNAMLVGSAHNLPVEQPLLSDVDVGLLDMSQALGKANFTADFCTSIPRWKGDQIWVSCTDNGFMVLQLKRP
ncbi:hypothetical protein B9Z52_05730 [Limnohabitans sp. Jir72]|nr:hypothetical protein B9Z52_05730 [Limnohabitans sp. Jir72]